MSPSDLIETEIRAGLNGGSSVNSYARKLWHGAKRNFYYRDDPSRAALLCKQIIAQFGLTPEADEARLLLHDIRLDIRAMAGLSEKESFSHPSGKSLESAPCPESWITGQGAKFGFAVAVVFLPLIGVARGGIIGIAVPEILALLVIGGVLWAGTKVRNLFR
jgi:hypothetical protein